MKDKKYRKRERKEQPMQTKKKRPLFNRKSKDFVASPASPPKELGHEDDKEKEIIYEEKLAGYWLRSVLRAEWEVHYNCQIPEEIMGYLATYFINPKYRPDLWLSINIDNRDYLLLLLEILSKEDIALTIGEPNKSIKGFEKL